MAIRQVRKVYSGMNGDRGIDVDRRVGEGIRHHDAFRSILVRHMLAWLLDLVAAPSRLARWAAVR